MVCASASVVRIGVTVISLSGGWTLNPNGMTSLPVITRGWMGRRILLQSSKTNNRGQCWRIRSKSCGEHLSIAGVSTRKRRIRRPGLSFEVLRIELCDRRGPTGRGCTGILDDFSWALTGFFPANRVHHFSFPSFSSLASALQTVTTPFARSGAPPSLSARFLPSLTPPIQTSSYNISWAIPLKNQQTVVSEAFHFKRVLYCRSRSGR